MTLGKRGFPGCLVSSCQDNSMKICDHIPLTYHRRGMIYHLTEYLNKISKNFLPNKSVKIFAIIMVVLQVGHPLIWTRSLRKGYLFLCWVGGLVSFFVGVADLKLFFFVTAIAIWPPLFMESRVTDAFLSSGLQCGHLLYISVVDKSALIHFLVAIALLSLLSVWTISLVNILLFLSLRVSDLLPARPCFI